MKKYLIAVATVVVILLGYYGVNAIFTKSYDIPKTTAKRGEMLISQRISGVVDAARAFTLSTPRIRGLQITWLASEGARVEEGDPVIKFDGTKQQADLTDFESSLKINNTSLNRTQKEYAIQEKNLELELQRAQRKYDEQKHEAPRLAEEAALELELAKLNFEGKLDQLRSDVQKAELEVKRAADKVTMAQKELSQLTISAPIPGMVVYLEIWKGGTMGKIQEGDSPWPGQGLINLPDLDEMIIKATVSEVDAAKIDSGQEVIIKLDAVPDREFRGEVIRKGTLAHKKDYNSKISVFDVEVAVLEKHEGIKPGMSASGRIVVERLEDVVTVPLESVFEKDGRTIVYRDNKDELEVTVGRRNDMDIQIISGLEGGETICLVDPTLDEPTMPGDRASEPELNKGRQAPGGMKGRGRRGGK